VKAARSSISRVLEVASSCQVDRRTRITKQTQRHKACAENYVSVGRAKVYAYCLPISVVELTLIREISQFPRSSPLAMRADTNYAFFVSLMLVPCIGLVTTEEFDHRWVAVCSNSIRMET
jgi:hypothetical protein